PGEVAAVGAGAVTTGHFGIEGIGHARGHSLANGIHYAADGLTAIAQRGRTTHHFDALGREGIDGHAVIGPDIGDVEAADAILEYTHTIGIHAADHWPARTGSEAAAGHTGHLRKTIGQRCG